jgi:hypothetical protein
MQRTPFISLQAIFTAFLSNTYCSSWVKYLLGCRVVLWLLVQQRLAAASAFISWRIYM